MEPRYALAILAVDLLLSANVFGKLLLNETFTGTGNTVGLQYADPVSGKTMGDLGPNAAFAVTRNDFMNPELFYDIPDISSGIVYVSYLFQKKNGTAIPGGVGAQVRPNEFLYFGTRIGTGIFCYADRSSGTNRVIDTQFTVNDAVTRFVVLRIDLDRRKVDLYMNPPLGTALPPTPDFSDIIDTASFQFNELIVYGTDATYDNIRVGTDVADVTLGNVNLASAPSPADKAAEIPRDTLLSWTPGRSAATHDVYFGTTFADVNNASPVSPRGALISRGQSDTLFNAGRLAFGQTYYWRIDEVNAPPDSTVFKGEIWRFATEPVAYLLDSKTITATASSAVAGQGPENTVNGSGLTADTHDNNLTAMWLTAAGTTGPAWIQYAFAKPVRLHEMWIWNHNSMLESILGFGVKDVIIEYSGDGTTFQILGTTHRFARASGQSDYVHNTVVAFDGVAAKYVKLTIQSSWGDILPQYGLSEVQFFGVPVYARQSKPPIGATGVAVDATLGWRAGREAAQHLVYLGSEQQAVAEGTVAPATVSSPSYPSSLNVASTYYWRVDEVNAAETPSTWSGDVWSFSTEEYLKIDDFESYTDDMAAGEAIWQSWIDGFETATNGSVVGNDPSPFAERTTLHSGKQSLPLIYDNTSAIHSEAMRTFGNPQNWTLHGVKGLTLWFYGAPTNVPQQMYVKINTTKIPYDGDAANLKLAQWQIWYIDLAGRNVGQVTTLGLGLDRLGGVGGSGRLLIDDLRLYSYARAQVIPVAPAATGLQARYQFEGNANDSAGQGRNGTVQGGATFVAGQTGQALGLDGVDDYVSLTGYKGLLADAAGVQQAFTVCAWIKTAVNGDILAWGTNTAGQRMNFRVDTVLRVEHGNGNMRGTNGPGLLDNEWHHVAATVPQAGTLATLRLYVDGRDVSAAPSAAAAFNLKADVDVAIGMGGPAGGRFFKGLIDDVRLYDRVLSVEEIAGLAGVTAPYDKSF